MIIVGTEPSLRDIMGPYFLAKFWRLRWGRVPSRWRLPSIGKPSGPGGSFWVNFSRKMEMSHHRHGRRRRRKSVGSVMGDIFYDYV